MPDFEVANLFWEIDPGRGAQGAGWVLIVRGVNVIYDVDRDKSGLRCMKKNQNLKKFRVLAPKKLYFLHKAKIYQLHSICGKRYALPKIRVAHGRP